MKTEHRLRGPAAPAESYWIRRREAVYRAFAQRCVVAGHRVVLDACCGDGSGSAVLASAGLEVTAVDSSRPTVARAARIYRSPAIAFAVGAGSAIDEPSAWFDASVCVVPADRISDTGALLGELRRVTRPGGLVLAAVRNRPARHDRTSRGDDGLSARELHAMAAHRFEKVRIEAVFHATRLRLVERVMGTSLADTVATLPPPDRAFWLRAALRRVTPRDFRVGPGPVGEAIDVVAVAIV